MPIRPKQILVIPLRFIGDTILSVPLLRNLKQHYPEATLDVLLSATAAPLLESCPYVDHVLLEAKSLPERLQQLQQGQYDTVFILRKSFTLALLCRLAGIKTLVGYDKQRFFKPFHYKRWGWLLDHQAPYPSLRTETPQAVNHLGLLSACGLEITAGSHLELWPIGEDEATVDQLFNAHSITTERPIAVLHTVSASHGKTLEIEKFKTTLVHLAQAGYQILCTGTQTDIPRYETLGAELKLPLINLAGQTTLRQTVALYKRIQLLVTVDSSPIHLAAAAGVPKIVGVFGPTNQKQWGPHNPNSAFEPVFVDLPCRPCYAKICEHNRCRTTLMPEQILQATQNLLGKPLLSTPAQVFEHDEL